MPPLFSNVHGNEMALGDQSSSGRLSLGNPCCKLKQFWKLWGSQSLGSFMLLILVLLNIISGQPQAFPVTADPVLSSPPCLLSLCTFFSPQPLLCHSLLVTTPLHSFFSLLPAWHGVLWVAMALTWSPAEGTEDRSFRGTGPLSVAIEFCF